MVFIFTRNSILRTALSALLFLLLVSSLVSCRQSDQRKYFGYLYFAQGSYLMRFSLRDSSLAVATQLGQKKIREISSFGEDRLLIAETSTVNRKNVARISSLELKTGQVRALYSGIQARYIAGADAIVYDDGSRIYSITQVDGTERTSLVLAHKRHQLAAMVEVSNGRLLIETTEDGVPTIHAYHVEDDTLTSLDRLGLSCTLKGAVWMDDLERLICRERDSEEQGATRDYIVADLDGRILARPSLPEGEKFLALAYISDQGALILKESWRGQIDGQEKSTVWVHDVGSGENQELTDAVNLGSSVVYTDY
jgi:hypothetical protein